MQTNTDTDTHLFLEIFPVRLRVFHMNGPSRSKSEIHAKLQYIAIDFSMTRRCEMFALMLPLEREAAMAVRTKLEDTL